MNGAGSLSLGMEHHRAGRLEQAMGCYRQAAAEDPTNPTPRYLLGVALEALGRPLAAIAELAAALVLTPSAVEPWIYLGSIRSGLRETSGAAAAFARAGALSPLNAAVRVDLGNSLRRLGMTARARRELRRAAALEPGRGDTNGHLAFLHYESGRTDESRRFFAQALAINPASASAQLGHCISTLPIFYPSSAAVETARTAYGTALEKLDAWADGTDRLVALAEAVGTLQPFYLAYQNRNDRDLQSRYGRLVRRAIEARHPDLSGALPRSGADRDRRLKVALVSGFFRRHSVWKMALEGWVRDLDRSRFELFGYHTGSVADEVTSEARAQLDHFTTATTDHAVLGRQIRADGPDVVLFPEIGMDPIVARVAAMRLAAVQATSWGHPTTSGYPTIDYFLSSELMEPDEGQDFYTERLVRLPGLGCSYRAPSVAAAKLSRADLGLDSTDLVLLCAQSLFKYRPEDDEILVRVAQELPNARLLFLAGPMESISAAFRERLGHRMRDYGIDPDRTLTMVPRLDEAGFAGLARVSDVLLDSIGWSGFNTTIELVAHGIPVVTMPDRFMRGRHTTALLRYLGVEELIATDRDDYVSRVVSLGRDPGRRAALGRTIAERLPRLFTDRRPIRALEDFLEQACRGTLSERNAR